MEIKRTRHAVYNINYHLVWCPKYRRPVLAGDVGVRLSEILPTSLSIAQIMHKLKGASSHQLRQEFPHLRSRLPSVWTRSYYAGTAGHVSAATIQRYIDEQRRS